MPELTLRERARFALLDREAAVLGALLDQADELLVSILDYPCADALPAFEPKVVTYSGGPALELELEGICFRVRTVGREPWLELLRSTGSTRLQSLADLGEGIKGQPLRWEGDDS